MGLVERPPQLRRISDRALALPGAVVHLWGWPGSGARQILDALAADRQAVWLDSQRGSLGMRPSEGRFVLWEGEEAPPAEVLAGLASSVKCLVVARQVPAVSAEAVIAPQELLLTEPETAALAQALTPEGTPLEQARRLRWATDGWLEPLALALAAGAGKGRFETGPSSLLTIPSVRAFVRGAVWDGLPAALREILLELSLTGTLDRALWAEAWRADPVRLRLLDEIQARLGWFLEEGSGERRLPRLLRAFLQSERDRLWQPAKIFARAQSAALAGLGLGQAGVALAALTAAGDNARVSQLLALEWLPLFLACDLPTLRLALRLVPSPPPLGAEFLRLVLEAVGGERRRAISGLAELAARAEGQPLLSATSRLTLAAIRSARQAQEVGALARRELLPLAPDSPQLEALIAAVEGHEREEGRGPVSPSAPLVQHLLSYAGSNLPRGGGEGGGQLALARQPGRGARAFHLRLFGHPLVFGLREGQRTELKWSLKRALRTFTFLASQPELAASRNQILEAVWAGDPEEAIEANFHSTLTHLRRTLDGRERDPSAPALLFQGGVYRLNPLFDWHIDIVEFESLAHRGRQRLAAGDADGAIELWQAAWRLYNGPFLDGFEESWVFARREQLERTYLQLLQSLGDLYVDHGEHSVALDAYRSALVADPLQERVHLAVMRLYARLARRDLVRHQYERLGSLLRQELGVEPLPETTAEFHRLMG